MSIFASVKIVNSARGENGEKRLHSTESRPVV